MILWISHVFFLSNIVNWGPFIQNGDNDNNTNSYNRDNSDNNNDKFSFFCSSLFQVFFLI